MLGAYTKRVKWLVLVALALLVLAVFNSDLYQRYRSPQAAPKLEFPKVTPWNEQVQHVWAADKSQAAQARIKELRKRVSDLNDLREKVAKTHPPEAPEVKVVDTQIKRLEKQIRDLKVTAASAETPAAPVPEKRLRTKDQVPPGIRAVPPKDLPSPVP